MLFVGCTVIFAIIYLKQVKEMEKEKEKVAEPISVDEAASKSIAAIIKNLDEYQRGERPSFSAYFFIENELHKIEHSLFLDEIGAREDSERPNVVITSSNVELFSFQQPYDECVVGYYYFDEETYNKYYPIISRSSL